jgi:hypothetical protein
MQISVDDWANCLGTIFGEILCGFKQRLPRLRRSYDPTAGDGEIMAAESARYPVTTP